jgi:chromate transporter
MCRRFGPLAQVTSHLGRPHVLALSATSSSDHVLVHRDPEVQAASIGGSVGEVARLFLRLGMTAFGGPVAHIALFRHEVVARRGWLTEQRFLDLLGVANLLPGPTSTEMAIGIGRDRAGWRGMLAAGVLFILPASLMVLALAIVYQSAGSIPQVAWLLYGIQPVAVAVVAHALIGLAPTAIRHLVTVVVAALAALLAVARIDPLLILLGGAAVGLAWGGLTTRFTGGAAALMALPIRITTPGSHAAALTAAAGATLGLGGLFLTFLKTGALVFGSGIVLLAFLRADFVQPGLLTDRQLLDAVAIGQVTPGPLFTTATFVGYLLAGVPGAVVATVAVFLPSFIFIALVHPMIDRIRRSAGASALLDSATAAALGLMAAVTFELGRAAVIDPITATLAGISLLILLRWRPNPAWLLAAGAVLGFTVHAAGLA